MKERRSKINFGTTEIKESPKLTIKPKKKKYKNHAKRCATCRPVARVVA